MAYPWEEEYFMPDQPPMMLQPNYPRPEEEVPVYDQEAPPGPPPPYFSQRIPDTVENPERTQERTFGGYAGFDLQGGDQAGDYTGPEGVTNVPGQAEQWRQEGKRVQFIADNPRIAQQAEDLGLGQDFPINVSKTSRQPGTMTAGGQTDQALPAEFTKFQKLWKTYAASRADWGGVDPLEVNPGDFAFRVKRDLDQMYDNAYAGQTLTPAQRAEIEKNKAADFEKNMAVLSFQQNEAAKAQNGLKFYHDKEEAEKKDLVKGTGKWGKIIGPPEAALPGKDQVKGQRIKDQGETGSSILDPRSSVPSPFPGPPPSEQQIGDFQKFEGLWANHIKTNWGGVDPLKQNPFQAKEAARNALIEQNRPFLDRIEANGPADRKEAVEYDRLRKAIDQAGDLAEEKIKNAQQVAHQEKQAALNFYNKSKQEQAKGEGKWIHGINAKGEQWAYNTTTKQLDIIPGGSMPKGKEEDPRMKAITDNLLKQAGLTPEAQANVKGETENGKGVTQQTPVTPATKSPGSAGAMESRMVTGEKVLDQATAKLFLRQAGWNGAGKPTEAQKQAARAMAAQQGFRTR